MNKKQNIIIETINNQITKKELDKVLFECNDCFRLHEQRMNESYHFNEDDEREIPMNTSEPKIEPSNEGSNNETQTINDNVRTNLINMRKNVLSLMGDESVVNNKELYKAIKSIWDSCDKILTK